MPGRILLLTPNFTDQDANYWRDANGLFNYTISILNKFPVLVYSCCYNKISQIE